MTNDEFRAIVKATGISGPSVKAARLVLVDGLSRNEAARRVGIGVAAVSRRVKSFPRGVCECCGHALDNTK